MKNNSILNDFDRKDNFYIRVRKGHPFEVYYNGIKPFTINKNKISKINEKLLLFNSTNINNNKQCLIATLKENRKKYYDKFELISISFKKGTCSNLYKNDFNDALNEVGAVYDGKKYIINKKGLSIEEEYAILKKIWIDYKRKNSNLFKNINIKYIKKPKEIFIEELKKSDYIPKTIQDYFKYTKPGIEKYYQHLFLLYANNKPNQLLFYKKMSYHLKKSTTLMK